MAWGYRFGRAMALATLALCLIGSARAEPPAGPDEPTFGSRDQPPPVFAPEPEGANRDVLRAFGTLYYRGGEPGIRAEQWFAEYVPGRDGVRLRWARAERVPASRRWRVFERRETTLSYHEYMTVRNDVISGFAAVLTQAARKDDSSPITVCLDYPPQTTVQLVDVVLQFRMTESSDCSDKIEALGMVVRRDVDRRLGVHALRGSTQKPPPAGS